MKKRKVARPSNKRRLTLAQKVARLRAANDRAEAKLKASPRIDPAQVWREAFAPPSRRVALRAVPPTPRAA